ncbi:efflux RND transporter periplasmic adaptor subunit [Derxia gummosa]|uniref:Efflux RND transporter periplasmic adaptor subunit n=1 Tax=Derxia gummosa DSM 723 TaxID=1121388 RepID=A0A9U5CY81_9BURK|nr:efflux RND transporter periplasmic adaptor subunit [Derxia gummosa]
MLSPTINKFVPLAIVVAVLAACGQSGGDQHAGGAPGGAPPAPSVGTVTVAARTVELSTELPGRTAAYQIAEVRPQVGGLLRERLFKEGAEVKAGAPLYQIDARSYQAAFDSAAAALKRAEATAESARLTAQRNRELGKIDAISKQTVEDSDAALAQAEADVAARRADVQTARINLDWTRVSAPITGRIGRSAATPGALVTAGQAEALATIQQLDPIYVDITQSSAELLKLRRALAEGQLKSAGDGKAAVRLTLEDGSAYALEGKLEFAEVSVDQATGAVTLRAVFPNPKGELLPGMYVRAAVPQGSSSAAITVPQRAVSRTPRGEAQVMVVGAEGKAEPRLIDVTRTVGDSWLVAKGLNAGDKVIVEGLQYVQPGAPVQAQDMSAAPAQAQGGNAAPTGKDAGSAKAEAAPAQTAAR